MPSSQPSPIYINTLPEYDFSGFGQLGQALLNYYSQRPTPRQPGTLHFPSGATTPTSPQELAAIRRAGGIPTTTGQQFPLTRLPATIPGLPVEAGTVGYQPPNRFNLPPSVQDIARLQGAKLPLEIAKLAAEAKSEEAYARAISGQGGDTNIVSLDDDTGQEVPLGSPNSSKYRKKITRGGVDYVPLPVKTPKPLSARQEDAAEGLQTTTATLGELQTFLKENPDIQTGLLHPSMRRNLLGDIARSFADPKITQFVQIANRMQDAYRRFVTGVQAGFPEVARFLPSSIPNPSTQPPEQFLAAIETFGLEVERTKTLVKRAMKLRGYSDEQVEEFFAPLPTFEELEQRLTETLSQAGQGATSSGLTYTIEE